MDAIDTQIVTLLRANARMPLKTLAARVELARSTVRERLVCACTLRHARRHCSSNVFGTRPSASAGTWPLMNSQRDGELTHRACA